MLLWSLKYRLYQPQTIFEYIWSTDGIIIDKGT
jgi:hypothetical protein